MRELWRLLEGGVLERVPGQKRVAMKVTCRASNGGGLKLAGTKFGFAILRVQIQWQPLPSLPPSSSPSRRRP